MEVKKIDGWAYCYVLTSANNLSKVLYYILPLPPHFEHHFVLVCHINSGQFYLEKYVFLEFSKHFILKPNTPVIK